VKFSHQRTLLDDINQNLLVTQWNTTRDTVAVTEYFQAAGSQHSNQKRSLANAKKARLLQQGIEPNPGPSQRSRNVEIPIGVSILNTLRTPGYRRALNSPW
jgi:hypothetical protein